MKYTAIAANSEQYLQYVLGLPWLFLVVSFQGVTVVETEKYLCSKWTTTTTTTTTTTSTTTVTTTPTATSTSPPPPPAPPPSLFGGCDCILVCT